MDMWATVTYVGAGSPQQRVIACLAAQGVVAAAGQSACHGRHCHRAGRCRASR